MYFIKEAYKTLSMRLPLNSAASSLRHKGLFSEI